MFPSARTALGVSFAAVLLMAADDAHAQKKAVAAALPKWDVGALERAREGAMRRLESAECLQLLDEFKDAEGRTLRSRLEPYGVSAAEYMGTVAFADGA